MVGFVPPLAAAVFASYLPRPEQLARSLAGASPEQQQIVIQSYTSITQAAAVWRDMQGQKPVAAEEPPAASERPSVAPEWVPVSVAAVELDRDPRQVRNYLKDGQLQGRRDGKPWQVSRTSLDAMKIRRARPHAA